MTRTAAFFFVFVLLLARSARAETHLIAVLPLDVRNAEGKVGPAAKASLEEMLRDVSTQILGPSGWTILANQNMLQILTDNGVDPARCGDENCQLAAAREIKVDKFISGSVQYVDGALTASIRLFDTRTGKILSSADLVGKTSLDLRGQFQAKAAEFFSEAEVVGSTAQVRETTGELFLRVDPPDATLQIDGGAAVKLIPGRNTVLTLPLGAHHLLLRKQGLLDYQQDFFIKPGGPVTIAKTLLAPPRPPASAGQAHLSIASNPDQAHIILDGQDTGMITPATLSGLAAGEHQVVLQRVLYLDSQARIVLQPDEPGLLQLNLTPNFGTLSIATNPPGATVYIDGGQQPGVTPLQVDHLDAKAYRVSLSLPQYDPVELTVIVQPGQTSEVSEALKPQFGTLVLRPKPDGATVYLDDTQLDGTTPITRERLSARTYRLRLTYPLHADFVKTVRIVAGETTVVDDELRSTAGGLLVTAEAGGESFAGAEVWVDGVRKGLTPLTLDSIPEGPVAVDVRAPLYRSWMGKALVVASKQTTVSAALAAEFGFLRASATPAGTLMVDGEPLGPATGDSRRIGMGAHHVTLMPEDAAHYRPDERDVVIEVGKTASFETVLAPRVGSVVVQTAPPGASIILDEQDQGQAPKHLKDIFAGKHQLRLELERYQPWTQEVAVEEGKTSVVDVALKSVDLVKYEAERRHAKVTWAALSGTGGGVLALTSGILLVVAHNFAAQQDAALQSYYSDTDAAAATADRSSVLAAHGSVRMAQAWSIVAGALAAGAFGWMSYEIATMPPAP